MKTWILDLLKKILGNGFLVLLIVAALYILYLRECKRPEPCPPQGQILLSKATWDSILKIANMQPIIHIDTVYKEGQIVYVPSTPLPQPKPEPKDTTINNYQDSLIKKDINVWYKFAVRGDLINRDWSYKPVISIIHEIDSIPYPKIVTVLNEIKIPQNGIYVYGIAGGNDKAFLFGGGVDYITKKNTEIGVVYQRFGSANFYSIKFGAKLFPKK